MRGFCSRCKEYRGAGEEWGVCFVYDDYPTCEKCGAYVDLEDQ